MLIELTHILETPLIESRVLPGDLRFSLRQQKLEFRGLSCFSPFSDLVEVSACVCCLQTREDPSFSSLAWGWFRDVE
jgi:hypothetical protein